jgi:hypothetical protein
MTPLSDDRDAGETKGAPTGAYARALLRFWWLLVLGAGIGLVAAVLVGHRASLQWPPKLSPRSHPTFNATATLLVDSPQDPYLRTIATQVTSRAPVVKAVRTKSGSNTTMTETAVPQPPSVSYQPPDTKTLVDAANLFPLLIESDQVARYREKLFGPTRGTVTADAAFASKNTYGAYKTSPLPVIAIDAVAGRPKAAKALADQTAVAFIRWLRHKQDLGRIPRGQRIELELIQQPTQAVSSGGSSKGLPIFVGLAVVVVFGGAAVLLDRLVPRRRQEPAEAPPESVPAGGTPAPDPTA